MPYPPPHGPPGPSTFQGIGLLPEEGLPDQTGHADEFLETDGTTASWEPVTGVLPDQTGHAGEFLTTDGVTASWAVVDALPSQTGHAGQFLKTDGVDPSWASIPATIYDVTNYGAVPNDPTNDIAPAFYAAIAAATQTQPNGHLTDETTIFGRVYIPTGTWYTSVPLCTPSGIEVCGDGPMLTMVVPGNGGPTIRTGNVQSFSGCVFYGATAYNPTNIITSPAAPSFAASLATGPGFSMPLLKDALFGSGLNQFFLHDSYPWSVWLGNNVGTTQFGLQFFLKITEAAPSNDTRAIISSRGPSVFVSPTGDTLGDNANNCFGVYAIASAGNWHLRCFLTTGPDWTNLFNPPKFGTQVEVVTGNISTGSVHYIELSYDGGFFDVYIDGVNQGHVSASGPVYRTPWEGVAIGQAGPEMLDYGGISTLDGFIDSIRLSSVPNHTGTSSYTPPTSKHSWDANTMALYNWDQGYTQLTPFGGGTDVVIPGIVGQVRTGVDPSPDPALATDGPLPHFIRMPGANVSADVFYHDFAIGGNSSCSGIILSNAYRNKMWRVWTTCTSMFAVHSFTAVSFFFTCDYLYMDTSWNVGLGYFGDASNINTLSCAIGIWNYSGTSVNINHQPTFNSFAPTLMLGGNGNAFAKILATNVANDAEAWGFLREISPLVVDGRGFGTLTFQNCGWDARGSGRPAVTYYSLPALGKAIHVSDTFIPNPDGEGGIPVFPGDASPCYISFPIGSPSKRLQLMGCQFFPNSGATFIPISDKDGWVSRFDADGLTNFSGLSIGEVVPTQLTGEFEIQDTYTTGGPVFPTAMPDTNYNVIITPKNYLGSAPAGGSNRVTGYVPSQTGFLASIETAPGAGSTRVFGYIVSGTYPPPEYFDFAPSVPSSFANPFSGKDSSFTFAVGMTLRPAANEVLTYNSSDTNPQTLLSIGTTPATAPWYELSINQFQYGLGVAFGSGFGVINQANVVNGRLVAFYSSGAHNIVINSSGDGSADMYLDGALIQRSAIGVIGTQTGTVYLGQRFDASRPLVAATIHNLKMDPLVARVFSNDNDIGPGSMDQAAFIGDELSIGATSTSAAGGWASQIAAADFGTTFWNMAALLHGTLFHGFTIDGVPSVLQDIWIPWGGAATAPPLTKAVVMIGLADIAGASDGGVGHSATDTWAKMLDLLEGTEATITWNPPTSVTSPTDQRAQVFVTGCRTAGVAHYVIDGQAITSTFRIDSHTTASDLQAAIVANGTLNATFDTGLINQGALYAVQLLVKVAGTGGNGIAVTCDGGGGAYCFGDVGGFPSTGLSVTTYNGTDTTLTIAGVGFSINFDTDAATTVNNGVSLINADPTVSPIVTAANVGNVLVITANATGAAGNSIAVASNGLNIPGGQSNAFTPANSTHLHGGSTGVINAAPAVVLCTIPPFGQDILWTSGKETERVALNALVSAYSQPNVTIYDMAASSASGGVAKPTDATLIDPTMVAGISYYLNDVGHTQVFTQISLLL